MPVTFTAMAAMSDLKEYRNLISDNHRWDGFEFRSGDIIISTPPKSGTTWTQMLCAMLVFDSAHFPAPMDTLSPWLDMNTRGKDEVFALLGSQRHRRFIKTHTPLDGLPMDPRVTYLVVGRDPRDLAISFEHHLANINFDSFMATRAKAVGNHDLHEFPAPPPPVEDPVERMRQFVEGETFVTNFDTVAGHLRDGWDRRGEANVALFHYTDYQADLPGELRRLADILGMALSADRAAELAAEADLGKMRSRAEDLAPDTGRDHWHSTEGFLRSGASGEWADRFNDELAARYAVRVSEYAAGDEDFAAWLHGGRRAMSNVAAF